MKKMFKNLMGAALAVSMMFGAGSINVAGSVASTFGGLIPDYYSPKEEYPVVLDNYYGLKHYDYTEDIMLKDGAKVRVTVPNCIGEIEIDHNDFPEFEQYWTTDIEGGKAEEYMEGLSDRPIKIPVVLDESFMGFIRCANVDGKDVVIKRALPEKLSIIKWELLENFSEGNEKQKDFNYKYKDNSDNNWQMPSQYYDKGNDKIVPVDNTIVSGGVRSTDSWEGPYDDGKLGLLRESLIPYYDSTFKDGTAYTIASQNGFSWHYFFIPLKTNHYKQFVHGIFCLTISANDIKYIHDNGSINKDIVKFRVPEEEIFVNKIVDFCKNLDTQNIPTMPDEVKVKIGSTSISVDGKEYPIDAAPYIQSESNSVLLPLRAVTLALCKGDLSNVNNSEIIKWNNDSKSAVIKAMGKVIDFTAESMYMYVDGSSIYMDNQAKAEMSNGRMFIPLRALGDAFNINVEWDAATKTVTLKPIK